MNLANKLTMLRIILIPFFIACFYIPFEHRLLIAAVLFVGAYITDMLDGRYARKHNMVTDFGKLMDPIADKLLTTSALVFMLACGLLPAVWGEMFLFLTVGRELTISGIRLIALTHGRVIAAGQLGKYKTVAQFITITFMLVDAYFLPSGIKYIADCVLIGITSVLTIWSFIEYAVKNRDVFSASEN